MSKPPAAERQRPPAGSLVLDHISHFVADLDAAAALLDRLGFAVTPPSEQANRDPAGRAAPAGTANRCVMLDEGYLEILTPTEDTPLARHMREQMARYSGVHLLAFGTPAAEAEHARLARHGFEPLPFVRLERNVKVEGGGTRLARFGVARVPPEKMPEGRIQFVEHLTPECLWQPRFVAHANGVIALAAAFVVADDPVEAGARYARFAGVMPRPAGKFVRLATARGEVMVGTREDWAALLGDAPAPPALAGYGLACADPDEFARRCGKAGLTVRKAGALHAALPPRALSGAWLLGTEQELAAWIASDT